WVRARCAAEETAAAGALEAMRQAATPAERLDAVRSMLMALSGLVAVAQLRRPTTRRTLALMHELLVPAGRADLHERALAVMGSADLGAAQVERLLADALAAFDRAVVVKRTPVPYGFAIQAHLRPYYLAGSREMIDQGLHREAMFWIACLDPAYHILANDAPPAEQPAFAAQFAALCAALGYDSDAAWPARVEAAALLTGEIAALAATLSGQHPE
ncbi:MAG TPA: hypothetical protein VGE07_14060, partial [Herpetosiphonaceae bacterium]